MGNLKLIQFADDGPDDMVVDCGLANGTIFLKNTLLKIVS